MRFHIFQIDAFADEIFKGNPACVVELFEWLPDEILLKIAKENAVAENAFFIKGKNNEFHLRWFTPEIEIDLCGHATLATAHMLKTFINFTENKFIFNTLSGNLIVTTENGLYTLDFPSRKPIPAQLPETIYNSLNIKPMEVFKSRDYVLIYNNEQEIKDLIVNKQIFDQINLDPGGVVVTAEGSNCDFVSRYFTPQSSILEDPVTGSAHCSLIPYWSERLHKIELKALQLSERQGKLFCKNNGERVFISGKAKTYLTGEIHIYL